MTEELKSKMATLSSNGFIKVTDYPLEGLSSEQKVVLNRKGNILLNSGRIEEAKKIFVATGYSDGLSRVAQKYLDQNKSLLALKLFILAHNKKKEEFLIEKLSSIISIMLKN